MAAVQACRSSCDVAGVQSIISQSKQVSVTQTSSQAGLTIQNSTKLHGTVVKNWR